MIYACAGFSFILFGVSGRVDVIFYAFIWDNMELFQKWHIFDFSSTCGTVYVTFIYIVLKIMEHSEKLHLFVYIRCFC